MLETVLEASSGGSRALSCQLPWTVPGLVQERPGVAYGHRAAMLPC